MYLIPLSNFLLQYGFGLYITLVIVFWIMSSLKKDSRIFLILLSDKRLYRAANNLPVPVLLFISTIAVDNNINNVINFPSFKNNAYTFVTYWYSLLSLVFLIITLYTAVNERTFYKKQFPVIHTACHIILFTLANLCIPYLYGLKPVYSGPHSLLPYFIYFFILYTSHIIYLLNQLSFILKWIHKKMQVWKLGKFYYTLAIVI